MTRNLVDLRKYHAPWQIGRPAPQFTIDEVAEAPRCKPQRTQRRHEVRHLEPTLVPVVRKQSECEEHAEQATVKAHAALPYRHNLDGVREVVHRLVEQHVSEAAPYDHPEHAVEEHVVHVARMPTGKQVLPRTNLAEHDEQHEPHEVHKPVPADRERTNVQGDWIELRMNEH